MRALRPDWPSMDNVIVTPHAASFSSPAVAQIPRRCGEEVARVLTHARPLHVVNPDVYATGHHRRSAGGSKRPICFVGALGSRLNVERLRLACCLRAPPRIWTFLSRLRLP
jgi:hypothetical protein